jgi:hypothetical protein
MLNTTETQTLALEFDAVLTAQAPTWAFEPIWAFDAVQLEA